MTRTEAIKRFLSHYAQQDLAEMYNYSMECQVNVRKLDGERVTGVYRGKEFQQYSNGIESWKPFRIPLNAMKDPEFEDRPLSFNLERYVEAIGMTGWDWENRCSRWVAYDFDAIVGHSEKHLAKLTAKELEAVKEAAMSLDYVTVRKSSSGNGLHLYIEVDQVETANHTEHSALARSLLGKMSLDTGFDFSANVDVCGGNMWVWHRKGEKNPEAFKLIKQGRILEDVPVNWRDHIKVSKGTRKKALPREVETVEDEFDLLTGRTLKAELDRDHRELMDWLKSKDAVFWWDSDNHMLVTHTWWLQEAQNHFSYSGLFRTDSQGNDKNTQNCFCFPMKNGAWAVRRFTQGCGEHESWEQDSAGWTRTFLNRDPDLKTAARAFKGVEDAKGNFNFEETEVAIKALKLLGVTTTVDAKLLNSPAKISKHKDGRVLISIESDDKRQYEMKGWHADKGKFSRLFSVKSASLEEPKGLLYDDSIRFLVESSGGLSEIGWFAFLEEEKSWVSLSQSSLKMMLKHLGLSAKEVDEAMGAAITRPWRNVVEPFQPEYLGSRAWNRSGAKLRYQPDVGDYFECPTWDRIFNHLGEEIDDAVMKNSWCVDNGILTGADYIRVWCASLFQKPKQPLPYLFFYSSAQNTGKSTLAEALSRLMTKGCVKASTCLNPQNTFNAELDGCVLAIVEETELDRSPKVYGRLKDYVTSPDLGIHPKGGTPYTTINTTHWIHTANNHAACPVFSGDTRIVVISVKPLKQGMEIPKEQLLHQLMNEASQFLGQMMSISLPEPNSRLAIPCIDTHQKNALVSSNMSQTSMFFNTVCEEKLGFAIKANQLLAAFHTWLDDPEEASKYSSHKFYKELPPNFQKGCASWGGGNYVPNLVIREEELSNLLVPSTAIKEVKAGTRLIIDNRGIIVCDN